ncbi:MAG: hypothetical protein AB7K36_07340 [Chloroflexota bacterium]
MVFLLIFGLMLTTIAVVVGRLAPRDSVTGLTLYTLHDAVYLPIKGYAYTAFLPAGLVWWGFGALLLTLLLTSWLTDRSLVRRPHAALTGLLLRLPFTTPWLVGGVRWLRRRGLPCDLLLQMAAYERELAVRRALLEPPGNTGLTRSAIRLTRLAVDLHLTPPADALTSVRAAGFLVAGLLAARLQRQDALATPLLEIVPQVASGLRAAHRPADDETGFTLPAFAHDLELLAEIQRRLVRLAGTERGRRDKPVSFAENVPRSRLRALAVAVDARRDVLEQARLMVETRRLYTRGGAEAESLASRLPDLPAEGLSLAGRLALDISLLVADLGEVAGLAEASLEAAEALALSLDLRAATLELHAAIDGAPNMSPTPSDVEARLLSLVAGLPRPEQYTICARLAASDPRGRLRTWASWASPGGVVRPADLDIIQQRHAALRLAGGPDA